MRSIALATVLILAAATASMAQESSGGDAALSYHWVRSNTPPGDCGCFGLNGGSVSGSWNLNGHWSAVAEIGAEHAGNVLSTGGSLTLTSYLGRTLQATATLARTCPCSTAVCPGASRSYPCRRHNRRKRRWRVCLCHANRRRSGCAAECTLRRPRCAD